MYRLIQDSSFETGSPWTVSGLSCDSDFHISGRELASKVGIPSRRSVRADSMEATRRVHIVERHLNLASGKHEDKPGSSTSSYFLTKPKQLIKFDLIVQISRDSPGAEA